MVTVYIIESLVDQAWYTGMALNIERSLYEHNHGKNRYTKGHIPWKLIYTEVHPDWSTARKREKYLKSAAGKIWVEKFFRSNS